MLSLIEKIYSDSKVLEKDFLEASIVSERIRAALLVSVLGFVILAVIILFLFFKSDYDTLFQNYPGIIVLLLAIFILVIYELSVRYLLGKTANQKVIYTKRLSYLNALIEISMPSILLIFLSIISNSPVTLLSPIMVTYFLIIILSTLRLNFWLSLFVGTAAAIEYVLIYLKLFANTSIEISLLSGNSSALYIGWGLMFISAGLAAGFVAQQIKLRISSYFKLYQERNEIVNLFGQQVSHSIVDVLLKQKPDLNAGKKNVTIMFLDIREFTPYSEKNAPEIVVEYLNTLFAMMIEIVNRHNGIINQFLGDGFMATFGAPVAYGNDTLNCVNAAREISHRIDEAVKSGTVPATKIGIGIHTGEAITGNIGTEIRRQYSITGNVVILASRIEQLNKKFDSQILLSDDALKKAGLSDYMVEDMGLIKLKGRQQKTRIFKLA